MNSTDVAMICKALGDSNRLQIIEILSGMTEECACNLLDYFDITQPTLSHHMKVLSECGLVNIRKDGKWNHYSINQETLDAFKNYIARLSLESKEACDLC